ncbi:MAG TPA: gliding motility-associated C-terminal domain-containing protein, partial [Bacteroidia bacterium]|nr:gliding motility-associated C-terminal domain-containing protein [Bacteroidia bacterium]
KWAKTIGGLKDDCGRSIVQSNDGGYMVAGYTNSYGAGGYDVYVIKLDSAGNVKWTETIGGKNDDASISLIKDKSNGYIITGWTDSYGAGGYDMYVVVIDSAGKIKQTRTIGGPKDEQAALITETANKGYCLAGYSYSFSSNNPKMYLVVLDSMLNNCDTTGSGGNITSMDSGRITSAGIITSKSMGYISSGAVVGSGGSDSVICIVYEPPKLTIITSPSCSGCTGTALANLTGYTASQYSYLWSNGNTNNYLTGLCTGKYILYIMYNGDTVNMDTVFIPSSVNPSVNIPSASIVDVKCYNGNNGTATAIASGGKPPYTYSWYPANQTTITANNLKAGTYTIVTTDSNGCAGIDTVTITQPNLLTINTSPDVSITAGTTTTITALASGGIEPYVYNWCDNSTGTSNTVSPITNTTYTIVVTDSNGCQTNAFITVDVICGNLFIPEAFSPNSDGKNDILYVRDYCIKDMDFVIFDRWGNKIFESENINDGWDGTYKGKPVNTGDFFYYLKATLRDGTTIEKKGNVALVR